MPKDETCRRCGRPITLDPELSAGALEGMHRLKRAPDGWPTVTPRIVARDAQQLVEFITSVFDASGEYSAERPAVLNISGSLIMISDAGARRPMPAFLYVYVEDTDRTFSRAVEAGAKTIEEPAEMPYGDRRAMVEDRWGNVWQIASCRS